MESRYATRSRTRRERERQTKKRQLRKIAGSSSSGEDSDVDEYGNIKDLIDYDYESSDESNHSRRKKKHRN